MRFLANRCLASRACPTARHVSYPPHCASLRRIDASHAAHAWHRFARSHRATRAIGGMVPAMKLSGIDANLLAALDALLREKSVTRAARRLGVGQPALSHSLSRLRDHFKDDLLVLRGRNYVLTDKAEKLASVVSNATRALADVFEERPSFDAATSSYRFVVACSDLFGIL